MNPETSLAICPNPLDNPKKDRYVLVPPGAPVPGAAAAAASPPAPASPAGGGGGAPESLSAFIRSNAL